MKTSIAIALPLLAVVTAASAATRTENILVIDDFKQGHGHFWFRTGVAYNARLSHGGGENYRTQKSVTANHILGGYRNEDMDTYCANFPCDANPFEQYASFGIASPQNADGMPYTFFASNGYDQVSTLSLSYGRRGPTDTTPEAGTSMHQDFSGHPFVRMHFTSVTGGHQNFILEMISDGLYTTLNCPFIPMDSPFTIQWDLSKPGGNAILSSITDVYFQFNQYGAGGYGISAIDASDTSDPNAQSCN